MAMDFKLNDCDSIDSIMSQNQPGSTSATLRITAVDTRVLALSRAITQMPRDPMYFPNCQPKVELENAITLLASWATK